MNTIKLQRNVQFLYEEQLARVELAALGAQDCVRDADNPWVLTAHVNGVSADVLRRSAYVGTVDGEESLYQALTLPKYRGGEFNRTRSVNQYLTHWIYPYRGKFHPQMVRALLNILGVGPGALVLEPYLGSGTTAVEASLLGADFKGVDLSPLCVLLTRVKTRSYTRAKEIRARVEELLASDNLDVETSDYSSADPIVADFLKIARMVTLSDNTRRKREATPALRKNLAGMLESVEAYAEAVRRFGLRPGAVDVQVGDCRQLAAAGVSDSSVDAIVTSPPYSIALDYVENDEHALDALGVDTAELRSIMTGVRGRGAREKLALYNEDMRAMFHEVARVLKPGARAAFVIGDATVNGKEHTTTSQMSDWAVDAGLVRERALPKIVYGLYSVMTEEVILIFRKPD
jgi:tRNA G10  N-methylase Trm11